MNVEIASYPKSGNTWFRHLVKSALKENFEVDYLPLDIHERDFDSKKSASIVRLGEFEAFIYKSHIMDSPEVKPDKIIHIYRHPLDVFLSAINQLYQRSAQFDEKRLSQIFLNGVAKSVEEIDRDGEMSFYFDSFLEAAGSNYWPGMLGEKSNYFNYNLSALENEKTVSIKYEDLLKNAEGITIKILNEVFKSSAFIKLDEAAVNKSTKDSGNTRFYWKAKDKNYLEYLTPEQVDAFNRKYHQQLKFLGY